MVSVVVKGRFERIDLIILSIHFFQDMVSLISRFMQKYLHRSKYFYPSSFGVTFILQQISLKYTQEPATFVFCILQNESMYVAKTLENTEDTKESPLIPPPL